jgi:hypothetical protein
MPINLSKVAYDDLNARQKENYNFLKVSAVLADYGFMTMRLSDDWQGADFIAPHVDGEFLKVQLKSRLTFDKRYRNKGLCVAFPEAGSWYLYPHDELLDRVLTETEVAASESWTQEGRYSYPYLSQRLLNMLETYRLGRHEGLAPSAKLAHDQAGA